MKIVKVKSDGFSEIVLDDFNRQQEFKRIYVRKDDAYVLEEQPGVMDLIQVDKDFRGRGIGRLLWKKAVEGARLSGASELYISACPSEETINFYKAMGADVTDNPIISIANDEPDDLQLVYSIV